MFLTTASQLADGMEQWMLRLTPNHTVSSATDMFANSQYGAVDAALPKGLRKEQKEQMKMQFPVTVKEHFVPEINISRDESFPVLELCW